jgi:hypothetical protein
VGTRVGYTAAAENPLTVVPNIVDLEKRVGY